MAAFHGDLRLLSVVLPEIGPAYTGERTLELSAVLGESRCGWTHLEMYLWC